MITDTLIQALLALTIIAVVVLIIVLFRLYKVLGNFAESGVIINKRVKHLDACLDGLEQTVNNTTTAVNGFVTSFEAGKKIKNKIKNFWD